jgi:hypothetical protein
MLLFVAKVQTFGMLRKIAKTNQFVNFAFLCRTACRHTFAAKILEQ